MLYFGVASVLLFRIGNECMAASVAQTSLVCDSVLQAVAEAIAEKQFVQGARVAGAILPILSVQLV